MAKILLDESSSSKHFKSGFYNTEDYVKSKTEQTVSEIINILSMDKDFKDIVEKLKANQLDMDTVKVLKRKVAIKYHPDKAKTESEKHAATERFQKIYGLIEILERTID